MVAFIIFLAVFTQSVTGFGSALVSMSVLPQMLGIRVAAPLVALIGGVLEILLIVRYRRAMSLRAVRQIVIASLPGVPLGILALSRADERLILIVLGMILTGYALYGLLGPRLPELAHPAWAYTAGFLGGLLGGAYNTSGPPVIVYGNCRRWPPGEFKGNLQGFFLVNSALIIAGHALSRNLTPAVWEHLGAALPAVVVGLIAGISLEKRIHPASFRRVVLWALLIMGVRLILG
jgi:uncharacterized membrane protein YfcA